MPISRTFASDLGQIMAQIYGAAADRLSVDVARRLDADIDHVTDPDWDRRRLTALRSLRTAAGRVTGHLDSELAEATEQMLMLAARRGGAESVAELARLGHLAPGQLASIRETLPGAEATQRLAGSLATRLRGTHLRIARWAEDVYREVTAVASADITLGVATRRQAAQRTWDQLVSRGVTGFVDRSGRRWALESYVDMATRTVAAQAAVEAHLDRLSDAGIDLVIVSAAPEQCPLCRPWQGQVLSRSGSGARTVEVQHAIRDTTVQVTVAGSIDDAVAAGLLHPNCRHSLSGYFPGVTTPRPEQPDPQGYADRQELRRLERQVRRDKLVEATALTDDAKTRARARVRAGQARIRQHVDDTGVTRLPWREQIQLGLGLGRRRLTDVIAEQAPAPVPRPTLATTRLPAPTRPDVPRAAREFHRSLAGIEDLALAIDRGTVRERRALTGGVSAETELVTLGDGRRVVYKAGGNAAAEQATSMIARALGLRAPRVYRDHPSAVWMDYVSDAEPAYRLRQTAPAEWERRRRAAGDHDDGPLVGLLDVLTANVDRHGGNWLLTEDGRTIPIDHGHAFPAAAVGTTRVRRLVIQGDFADDYFGDNPLTAADVEEARFRLETLRPDFEHMGRSEWLDYALGALDLVARRTAGTRNLIATMRPQ